MKHYLNTNIVAKSFVLAGALTLGVFSGGHFTEAASPNANSVKTNVNAKTAMPAAPEVKGQPNAEMKLVNPIVEKVNKSQASVHASETAKIHAAPNSAVHGKVEQAEDVVTDEEIIEAAPVQEPVADEAVDLETGVIKENQDNDPNSETEETANLDTDVAVKTEEEEVVAEEETNLDADTAVKAEDDGEENSDSEKVTIAPDAIVKTNEDEEAEAPEEDVEKEAKVNPSAANKANSQASVHASENAKEHAAANSAVLAGTEVGEEVVTEEATLEAATKE